MHDLEEHREIREHRLGYSETTTQRIIK